MREKSTDSILLWAVTWVTFWFGEYGQVGLEGALISGGHRMAPRCPRPSTGTDVIDLRVVAASLREAGYEGQVSVEFAVDDDQNFVKSPARSHDYAMALWQNEEA